MSEPPFTVVWRRYLIETQLAEIVFNAVQQGVDIAPITEAMNTIDQLLAHLPETRGESRGDFERILMVPPLAVTFEIHEEQRIVYVLRLVYRPRKVRD